MSEERRHLAGRAGSGASLAEPSTFAPKPLLHLCHVHTHIKQLHREALLTLQTHSLQCGEEWHLHFIDLAADREAVPQDVSHPVPECAD